MAARYSDSDGDAERARELRERVLPLARADAEAYAEVLRSSGDERSAALSRAADVPLQVAEAAAGAAALAARLAAEGKESLRGDAAAGAVLAAAAARVGATLVAINLAAEPDDDRVEQAADAAAAADASARAALTWRG